MNAETVKHNIGRIVLHRMSGRYGRLAGLTTSYADGSPIPGGLPRAVVDFASGREILTCRSINRSVEYDHRPDAIASIAAITASPPDDKPQRQAVKSKRGQRV